MTWFVFAKEAGIYIGRESAFWRVYCRVERPKRAYLLKPSPMSTSQRTLSSPEPSLPLPPTPDGYAEPSKFSYPTALLIAGSSLLGIGTAVAVVSLLTAVHGPETFTFFEVTVDGETSTYAMALTALGLPFLIAL